MNIGKSNLTKDTLHLVRGEFMEQYKRENPQASVRDIVISYELWLTGEKMLNSEKEKIGSYWSESEVNEAIKEINERARSALTPHDRRDDYSSITPCQKG